MSKKRCCICKDFKALDNFTTANRNKDGLSCTCKGCKNRIQSKYRKTKEGLISSMYQSQRFNSKRRNHHPPIYTKKELRDWLLKQDLFHELFDNWVKSGNKKDFIPSVDRKRDYESYTLDNIQLTYWKENRDRGHRDRINGINNKQSRAVLQYDMSGNFIKEYYSMGQASRDTEVSTGGISYACKNIIKQSGGFRWEYKFKNNIMITLLNSKIEDEILTNFEENIELEKESYECIFNFDGFEILVPYTFKHEIVSYRNDEISATKDGVTYGTEDREHFLIKRCNHNPNKRTLQQEIDSIVEHEERKQYDRKKSSKDIEETNDILNDKNR